MNVNEIKSLTGIRGLAALYVVIYHWYEVKFTPPVVASRHSSIHSMIENFLSHGYLAVDLFFVLSGFVLCLSSYKYFGTRVTLKDYTLFIKKRFFRIFPLYIAITLLYYISFREGGLINFVVNLTLFQGLFPHYNESIIPPGWSLTNEWILYFIFPLLLCLATRMKDVKILLALASVALLILICCVRGNIMNWGNFVKLEDLHGFVPSLNLTRGISSIIRTIAAYFLGILTFFIYRSKIRIEFSEIIIVSTFALLFVNGTDILIVISLPIFIYYITHDNALSRFLSLRPIYFLGLISYSLYVNHYLFIKSYDDFSIKSGFQSNLTSFLYIMTGTLCFSVFTYYLIEKPGLKVLEKLGLIRSLTRWSYGLFARKKNM